MYSIKVSSMIKIMVLLFATLLSLIACSNKNINENKK